MVPDWIIAKKRDGGTLSAPEIEWVIAQYSSGAIPDYQMAALAMAIYLRGMSVAETAALTAAMLQSGTRLRWQDLPGPVVDKHSTGGVGDKISLILAPLLASCGLFVPMLSGRGLGATGGTLDKLEAIPGFRTDLSLHEIQSIVRQVGCVITGTTNEIAPADRELYALRDVTATVASIPLITASIMSKKLAEGIQHLVLDVKYGSGAFMKELASARQLAESLIRVGRQMDLDTSALLTDMNQPLGRKIGNTLEVEEAIDVLQGKGPQDVRDVSLALATRLLVATRQVADPGHARQTLETALTSGCAWEKWEQMVVAQGGHLRVPRKLAGKTIVLAKEAGFVHAMDTEQLGRAVIALGGGRTSKGMAIDPAVGLEMHVRCGDPIDCGQPLVTIYGSPTVAGHVRGMIQQAISIRPEPLEHVPTRIHGWVEVD